MYWLKEIDNKKIVGAVQLDFSAAFDIIDHNLLLRKHMFHGFSNSAILWLQNYLSIDPMTQFDDWISRID